MMFTATFNPAEARFVPPVATPLIEAWPRVAALYRDAWNASAQHMLLSSMGIVQEHTLRAFAAAAQSCADALAKNAIEVQQQSMARFAEVNQQALGMMGRALTEAWMGGWKPAK